MVRPISIAPSVLPSDFARLGEDCLALEKAGVDRIQWDVMDGHFVPNLTFGPDVIAAVRPHVSVPFEAHLMVERPDDLLDRYVEAGCHLLIVHQEACPHLHRTLGHVRDLGGAPAVALNPATPIDAVEHVLDLVELV
jgi:ribulose-phosphate 3-epimerase